MPTLDYLNFVPLLSLEVHNRADAVGAVLANLEEYDQVHLMLDGMGVPRTFLPGSVLSLPQRLIYVSGQLESARRVVRELRGK